MCAERGATIIVRRRHFSNSSCNKNDVRAFSFFSMAAVLCYLHMLAVGKCIVFSTYKPDTFVWHNLPGIHTRDVLLTFYMPPDTACIE